MELKKAILRRRSGRTYNGQPVTDEQLRQILTAGLLCPNSKNQKTTEFITVRSREMLTALAEAKAFGAAMLKTADCAILVIGDSAASDAWIENASIAMTQMMLTATDLKVANCWVHYRNRFAADGTPCEDKLRGALGIPEGFSVLCALSLGIAQSAAACRSELDADWSKVHPEHF